MAAKTKTSGWRRFFRVSILLLNSLAVVALLLAYLAPYISPEKNAWLPFAGIAYPILAITNAGFVIFWLFFRWKFALVSLIALLAGWNHLMSHLQFHGQTDTTGQPVVKVMSYNVRNFDLYNYDKNWKTNQTRRNQILRLLHNTRPDIICFQEYVHDVNNDFNTTDTLCRMLAPVYADTVFNLVSRKIIKFGLATFSKYPIVGHGQIHFSNSRTNFCIFTDLLIDADTVRVYNAHFESIRLSQKDLDYTHEAATTDMDKHKTSGKRIVSQLKAAFADRAAQTELVAAHMAGCRYPIILCTDLNDTPTSYSYRRLKNLLDDSFSDAGKGFGNTYTGVFPPLRIDFIMHSKGMRAVNFKTYDVKYSDHYPISCELTL